MAGKELSNERSRWVRIAVKIIRYATAVPLALLFSFVVLIVCSYTTSIFTVGIDSAKWAVTAPSYGDKYIAGTIFTLSVYPAWVASFFAPLSQMLPDHKVLISKSLASIFLAFMVINTSIRVYSSFKYGDPFGFYYKLGIELIATVIPTIIFLMIEDSEY